MTKYEMEKVVKIIENNMTVLPDYMTNLPRMVLTNHGLKNVKDELQQMVEVIK